MENVKSFTQADAFNPKFYPEARKLHNIFICDKTVNNACNTVFVSITTIIPLDIQK